MLGWCWLAAAAGAAALVETPALAEAVAAGRLPAVSERVPRQPLITTFGDGQQPGRHGGELHMLIASGRDLRLLSIYGYARLVGYTAALQLQPDILEAVEVEDGRRFTLRLRPGHRWSDGAPFTSEDFRYFWEDVANNAELSPAGPPRLLLVEGKPPVVDFPDPHTVRYTWEKPNPLFLPALAGPSELSIYRPAHYLRQFHRRYADAQTLRQEVESRRQRSWAALHNDLDSMYRMDNPDMPSLQPWINVTQPPAGRFVAERNPFFHRIDGNGRQLPYLDRVVMTQASAALIPARVAAGEAGLQARYLSFNDFTFLKQAEAEAHIRTLLWHTGTGAQFALYPNLNIDDPVWRALFRDVRFRRALSLAIDRELINQAMFFGLALPGNNTVLPSSPLFRDAYASRWAVRDIAAAQRLLDEIGLTRRNGEGIRLLTDGRPLQIIVETAGEDTQQTDILEVIRDDWRAIGVKLFTTPSQREVFRNRIFAGQAQMAVWSGWENGIPTADMSPAELAPTTQQGLQWPKWGQYYETSGSAGEPVDVPEVRELLDLNRRWLVSRETGERQAIWQRMLEIHADQVFIIGVVRGAPQPVVIRSDLRNVPATAIYNWEPGAHFGIYRPDTFWYE